MGFVSNHNPKWPHTACAIFITFSLTHSRQACWPCVSCSCTTADVLALYGLVESRVQAILCSGLSVISLIACKICCILPQQFVCKIKLVKTLPTKGRTRKSFEDTQLDPLGVCPLWTPCLSLRYRGDFGKWSAACWAGLKCYHGMLAGKWIGASSWKPTKGYVVYVYIQLCVFKGVLQQSEPVLQESIFIKKDKTEELI